MKQVVKHRGQLEAYDERKVYASAYASVLAVRDGTREADEIADRVCKKLHAWLQSKTEVTTSDIRHQVSHALDELHPQAGYLYKHHRILM